MRLLSVAVILPTFLTISRKKPGLANIETGIYKGTFQRSGLVNKISDVTLKFSSDSFEGQSQYIHYPDICKGAYSAGNGTAVFKNSCFYTAEFDWSYILSGKFTILNLGDSIIMTRSYNEPRLIYDTYKLRRQ